MFWQKLHCVDHKRLVYAIKIFFNHPYTLEEQYETPKQQWSTPLIAQHPMSHVERVPKI